MSATVNGVALTHMIPPFYEIEMRERFHVAPNVPLWAGGFNPETQLWQIYMADPKGTTYNVPAVLIAEHVSLTIPPMEITEDMEETLARMAETLKELAAANEDARVFYCKVLQVNAAHALVIPWASPFLWSVPLLVLGFPLPTAFAIMVLIGWGLSRLSIEDALRKIPTVEKWQDLVELARKTLTEMGSLPWYGAQWMSLYRGTAVVRFAVLSYVLLRMVFSWV